MHSKKYSLTLMIGLSVFVLLLTSCQAATPTQATDPSTLQVTVSIVPLAYFVDRIGGDLVYRPTSWCSPVNRLTPMSPPQTR